MTIDVKRLVPQHLLDYPVTDKILDVFQHVVDFYGEDNVLEVLKFYDPLEATALDKFLTTFGVRDMVEEIVNDPDINVENFAATATILATSEATGHGVELVHDQNTSTYWGATSGVNEGLDIDLGQEQIVRLIVIDTAAGTTGSSPRDFVLQASTDGIDYSTILTGLHGRPARVTYHVDNEQPFRWYRLAFLDTGGDSLVVHEVELYRSKAEEMRGLGLALKSLLSIKGTLAAVHYTLMRGHAPTSYDFIEWFKPDFELDPTSADVLEDFHGWCSIRIPVDDWAVPPSTIYQQNRVEARWVSVGVFLLPWFLRVYQWIYLKVFQDYNPAILDYLFTIITQYMEDIAPEILDNLDTVVGDRFEERWCLNGGPIYGSFIYGQAYYQGPKCPNYGEFEYGDGSRYGVCVMPQCAIYDVFYGIAPSDLFLSTVPPGVDLLQSEVLSSILDNYSFPPVTDRATIITEFHYADIDTDVFDTVSSAVVTGLSDSVSSVADQAQATIVIEAQDSSGLIADALTTVTWTDFQDQIPSPADQISFMSENLYQDQVPSVLDSPSQIILGFFSDVSTATTGVFGAIIKSGVEDVVPGSLDSFSHVVTSDPLFGQVNYGNFVYGPI